jgi:hypothetical protein
LKKAGRLTCECLDQDVHYWCKCVYVTYITCSWALSSYFCFFRQGLTRLACNSQSSCLSLPVLGLVACSTTPGLSNNFCLYFMNLLFFFLEWLSLINTWTSENLGKSFLKREKIRSYIFFQKWISQSYFSLAINKLTFTILLKNFKLITLFCLKYHRKQFSDFQ